MNLNSGGKTHPSICGRLVSRCHFNQFQLDWLGNIRIQHARRSTIRMDEFVTCVLARTTHTRAHENAIETLFLNDLNSTVKGTQQTILLDSFLLYGLHAADEESCFVLVFVLCLQRTATKWTIELFIDRHFFFILVVHLAAQKPHSELLFCHRRRHCINVVCYRSTFVTCIPHNANGEKASKIDDAPSWKCIWSWRNDSRKIPFNKPFYSIDSAHNTHILIQNFAITIVKINDRTVAFLRNASFDNYMVGSVLATTTTTQAHNKMIFRICVEWQLQAYELPQMLRTSKWITQSSKRKTETIIMKINTKKKNGFIKI